MVVIAILVIIIKYTLEDVSLVLWPTNFFSCPFCLALGTFFHFSARMTCLILACALLPCTNYSCAHLSFALFYQWAFVTAPFCRVFILRAIWNCKKCPMWSLYKNNIAIVWKTGGVFDLEFRKNGFHLKKITCL